MFELQLGLTPRVLVDLRGSSAEEAGGGGAGDEERAPENKPGHTTAKTSVG
ncbi:MAG: hypothetical protein ACI9KE_000850, partial [Polyangiales bacterium]